MVLEIGVLLLGGIVVLLVNLFLKGWVIVLIDNMQGVIGFELYEVYNNGYLIVYGNIIYLKGMIVVGEGELFIGWSGISGVYVLVFICL